MAASGGASGRGGGWASVELLRTMVLRLNRSYRATPVERLKRWWRGMWGGAAAVLLLTASLVFLVRWIDGRGLLLWEADAIRWMEARVPISFSFAMWLEGIGNGFVLWGVVLYSAATSALRNRALRALSFLVGHSAVYLPISLAWFLWNRPRPRLILDGVASPGGVFHAFPSGHMVQSAFAYGLLLALWMGHARSRSERAFALVGYLVLIALIGFGRLRIGVHWPSDIVGGALIGGAWAWAVARAGGLHDPPRPATPSPVTPPTAA